MLYVRERYLLFFADLKADAGKSETEQTAVLCRAIRDLIPKFYSCSVTAC